MKKKNVLIAALNGDSEYTEIIVPSKSILPIVQSSFQYPVVVILKADYFHLCHLSISGIRQGKSLTELLLM